VPQLYRSICFEGRPAKCYELAGKWLGLPEEWDLGHLDAALMLGAEGDGDGADSFKTLPAVVVGGYPTFLSALLASLSEGPIGKAVDGTDCDRVDDEVATRLPETPQTPPRRTREALSPQAGSMGGAAAHLCPTVKRLFG